MRNTVHIPRPVRRPDLRDYPARFEAWLGYRLRTPARRVIAELERQRARHRGPRLYVCDNDAPSGLIQRVLADYARFLASKIWTEARLCMVGRSRKQVESLLPRETRKQLPQGRDQAVMATARSPEYTRGLNFEIAVMLDADSYPRRGRHFGRVWASVIPCIGEQEHTVAVVHGTFRPLTRVNVFTNRVRDALEGFFDWPLLDLSKPPSQDGSENSDDSECSAPEPLDFFKNPRKPLAEFRLFFYALRHWREDTLL